MSMDVKKWRWSLDKSFQKVPSKAEDDIEVQNLKTFMN